MAAFDISVVGLTILDAEMQQIADHMARFCPDGPVPPPSLDRDIRAVKRRLWHGRVDRAIRDLEGLLARLSHLSEADEASITRLHSLGAQLLTYVDSNRGAIINYGKRYRAGLRVASTLAETAVNSLVGKRMVKKRQIRWSMRGAHMVMQVRTAELNGELRDRLRAEFRAPGAECAFGVSTHTTPSARGLTPEKLPVSIVIVHSTATAASSIEAMVMDRAAQKIRGRPQRSHQSPPRVSR